MLILALGHGVPGCCSEPWYALAAPFRYRAGLVFLRGFFWYVLISSSELLEMARCQTPSAPPVISSWLLGLLGSSPACLASGIRIVTDLIAKSPRLCETTEHFGDKIFSGKRSGGTPPGCFGGVGSCHKSHFHLEKRREGIKRGVQVLWEVVGSHHSWVWNMLAMGTQIMISDRLS